MAQKLNVLSFEDLPMPIYVSVALELGLYLHDARMLFSPVLGLILTHNSLVKVIAIPVFLLNTQILTSLVS